MTGTTSGARTDCRAWGRKIAANAGTTWTFNLAVPGTGDYDLYLYAGTPDAKGNPVIVASSAHAGNGVAESMTFTSVATATDYLFVKRVSGSGAFSLAATNRPCGNGIVESGEQCDDGNLADGDCCSSLCQVDPNGTACSDGSLCTRSDTCQGGACVGSNPGDVHGVDACHVAGVCNPSTGVCSSPPAMDGIACNDGNACTASDACQAGACVGSNPVTCTASDVCHVAGVCNPSSRSSPNPAAQNGTVCTDGNACTATDTCQGGACVGASPKICAASDACHVAGTCEPARGACSNRQRRWHGQRRQRV